MLLGMDTTHCSILCDSLHPWHCGCCLHGLPHPAESLSLPRWEGGVRAALGQNAEESHVSTSSSAIFEHKHFSDCCMLLDNFQSVEMGVFVNLCNFNINYWRGNLPTYSSGILPHWSALLIGNIVGEAEGPWKDGSRRETAGYEALKVGLGWMRLHLAEEGKRQCPQVKGFPQVLEAQ